MSIGKGVPYIEVAEKALEAEEAELKVVKALEIRRNINKARRNANFGKGTQPGFNGGKRKFPQGQEQRQDPSKRPAVGQQMQPILNQKVTCPKCEKPHKSECLFGSKVCYTCGKTGHFSRECPSTSGEQKKVPACMFTMTTTDAEADPSVVAGEISIFDILANTLIDSGATHSFASPAYVRKLGRSPETFNLRYCVTIPSGDVLYSGQVLRACPIKIEDRELWVDLIVLDMLDFEVILGMDWLSKYHASIDCNDKRVVFQPPGEEKFTFLGSSKKKMVPIISMIKARKLLEKGCTGYLANVMDTREEVKMKPE